jgi:hypothetical protein
MFADRALNIPERGKEALDLLANIKLGWRDLQAINPPAYLAPSYITKKMCYNIGPGLNVIKLVLSLIS